MAFSLTFETENTAFDGAEATETCRILRYVAEWLEEGTLAGPVRDCNGNTVGAYALSAPGGAPRGVPVVLTRDELEIVRVALTDREGAVSRAGSPGDPVAVEAVGAVILTRQKINAALWPR